MNAFSKFLKDREIPDSRHASDQEWTLNPKQAGIVPFEGLTRRRYIIEAKG